MAHIESFSIEGLAGREKLISGNLNRHLNIFFGPNGSGKSSLLKILYSAMRGDASMLIDVPFKEANVVIYSISLKKTIHYRLVKDVLKPLPDIGSLASVDLQSRREMLNRLNANWRAVPAKSAVKTQSWHHTYLPTTRLYTGAVRSRAHFETVAASVMIEQDLERHFATELQSLWQGYSAEIFLKVRQAQAAGLESLLKAALSESDSAAELSADSVPNSYLRVKSFLKRQRTGAEKLIGSEQAFAVKLSKNAQFKTVVADLVEVEKNIEVAMRPIHGLQDTIKKLFSGNKHVVLDDGKVSVRSIKGDPIELETLSSGEKHVLKILIAALTAAESTLIIDEPELSLHIDWQKILVDSLRSLNPSTQLILASHSPEILASANDEHIFRV